MSALFCGGAVLCLALHALAAVAEPSAEAKALAYLAREVPAWREQHSCGSCHNNGDAARALLRARRLGREVPDAALASTLAWLDDPLEWERAPGEPGTSDATLARIQFAAALAEALAAGALEERGLLLEAAARLAPDQHPDGAWRIEQQGSLGSPVAYGPSVATWLARRTLAAADPERFAAELAAAESWLLAHDARNVMDAAATVLGLKGVMGHAAETSRGAALSLLLDAQTSDGGWGPYRGSPPEAFDTALALLALADGRRDGHLDAIRRGRAYLRRAQLSPGGWPETTRPAGYVSYAQHISTTGWATLALLETAEWGE